MQPARALAKPNAIVLNDPMRLIGFLRGPSDGVPWSLTVPPPRATWISRALIYRSEDAMLYVTLRRRPSAERARLPPTPPTTTRSLSLRLLQLARRVLLVRPREHTPRCALAVVGSLL